MPRFDADWIDSMLEPQRRGAPLPEETLEHVGVKPGQIIVDYGCGPGFFTIPAARLVRPRGRVLAIDPEPAMLDVIRRRADEAGLGDVETMLLTDQGVPLPSGLADLTICSLVLHDLDEDRRLTVVSMLRRVTRQGGAVVIVEWRPDEHEQRPNRLAPAVILALLAAAGMQPGEPTMLGTRQYLVVGH